MITTENLNCSTNRGCVIHQQTVVIFFPPNVYLKVNYQRLPIEKQVSGDLFQFRERDIGILRRLGVVDQQNLYEAFD